MSDHASESANQLRTEPLPASATESEAETPGTPGTSGQGHQPSTGTGTPGDSAGVPVTGTDAAPGSSEQLPVVQGLHVPELDEGVHRD